MDLRIVKTKKNIHEQFMLLRAKHPLEKIRVTELCENASINKTTFYKHYQDIFALSEEVENDLIESIMKNCRYLDALFTDTTNFVREVIDAFSANLEPVTILFDGRMNVLIEKVERILKERYCSNNNTPEEEILLSFVIGGAAHVMLEAAPNYQATIGALSNVLMMIRNGYYTA